MSSPTKSKDGEDVIDEAGLSQGDRQNVDTQREDALQVPRSELNAASQIDKIRVILSAAVQHFGINVPMEALPDAESNHWKPDNIFYYEEGTIEYLKEQVPREGIADIAANFVRGEQQSDEIQSDEHQSDEHQSDEHQSQGSSEGEPRHYPGPNEHTVFEWDLPRESDTMMWQWGYDSDGHFELLSAQFAPKIAERFFRSPTGSIPSPVWKDQRFGKEWDIACHEALHPQELAVILGHFCRGPASAPPGMQLNPSCPTRDRRVAAAFVNQFTKKWNEPPVLSKGNSWATPHQFITSPLKEDLSALPLHFHMRFFTKSESTKTKNSKDVVHLERAGGFIRAPHGDGKSLYVREARLGVTLYTTTKQDLPIFSLLGLHDDIIDTTDEHDPDLSSKYGAALTGCKDHNIHSWRRGAGIAAFAFRIRCACAAWAQEWRSLFAEIDSISAVGLKEILSQKSRRKMMYDDAGSEFALSEFYFTLLQLLRLASEWIQESMDDLHDFVETLEEMHMDPKRVGLIIGPPEAAEASIKAHRQSWDSVTSYQQRLGKELLGHISRKQEEIKSLRDGLFSATSVSEAAKSAQLNHYILVFTVVTIFYLPLGFVTALFALGLFDWENPGQTTAFVATIIVVAGSTYGFSGLLIWLVRKAERREVIKKPAIHIQDAVGNVLSRNIFGNRAPLGEQSKV